jgi:hypothetical protein
MTRDEIVISEAQAAEATLTKLLTAAAAATPDEAALLRYAKKAHAALQETQTAYHPFAGPVLAVDQRQLRQVLQDPNVRTLKQPFSHSLPTLQLAAATADSLAGARPA